VLRRARYVHRTNLVFSGTFTSQVIVHMHTLVGWVLALPDQRPAAVLTAAIAALSHGCMLR
jgi:hypothetical protein